MIDKIIMGVMIVTGGVATGTMGIEAITMVEEGVRIELLTQELKQYAF